MGENGRAPRCCPGCLLVPSEADCWLPRTRFRLGWLLKWWVVPVSRRRWPGRAAALQAAHDLYVTNNPKWMRDVESHHDQKAYEAPRVLNLPAFW